MPIQDTALFAFSVVCACLLHGAVKLTPLIAYFDGVADAFLCDLVQLGAVFASAQVGVTINDLVVSIALSYNLTLMLLLIVEIVKILASRFRNGLALVFLEIKLIT